MGNLDLYRKKNLIEVVEHLENGDVKVRNHQGDEEDTWIIPSEIFKDTYEKVENNQ